MYFVEKSLPLESYCTVVHSSDVHYEVFLKMGQPRPLFLFIFGLFKQTIQFLQQIYVKKCPSSIWCRDLNPQPLERESLPITTRPGLLPHIMKLIIPQEHYFIVKTF